MTPLLFALGSKVRHLTLDISSFKSQSWAVKKKKASKKQNKTKACWLDFSLFCSLPHSPESPALTYAPGLGLLPPQSMHGHQIHLPRTLLLTRHFPAGKSLMIPHHLESNFVSWHLQSDTAYLLDSCMHKFFLTPSGSPAGGFTNLGSSPVCLTAQCILCHKWPRAGTKTLFSFCFNSL